MCECSFKEVCSKFLKSQTFPEITKSLVLRSIAMILNPLPLHHHLMEKSPLQKAPVIVSLAAWHCSVLQGWHPPLQCILEGLELSNQSRSSWKWFLFGRDYRLEDSPWRRYMMLNSCRILWDIGHNVESQFGNIHKEVCRPQNSSARIFKLQSLLKSRSETKLSR